MATKTIFHPYRVINQTPSSLELGSNSKATMWLLRLLPLFVPVLMVIILSLNGGAFPSEVIYIILGVTLFMYLILALIKTPAAVRLDSLGMTVTNVSIFGHKEEYILWSDIDRFEQSTQRTKNGKIYTYRLIRNDNKKIKFLQFSGLHFSANNIPEINNILHQLSLKQVTSR
jgi:hypothetical protein